MANERLEPFRDYSEHDVLNLFAFGDSAVALGTTDVVYAGSCVKVKTGWSNSNEAARYDWKCWCMDTTTPFHSGGEWRLM